MAALRILSRNVLNKPDGFLQKLNCVACTRLLNYQPMEYDKNNDPRPQFFKKDVQNLLTILTRIDPAKVFMKRKLGGQKLKDPEYRFMTDEELQSVLAEAKKKSEELMQIPPVVPVKETLNRIIAKEPAIQGLDTAKYVFTDITFGVSNRDRLIAIREPDGTLREAEWDERRRINQIYFPTEGRNLLPPHWLQDDVFENLLNRKEYVFILDSACVQYDPDEPPFHRVMTITYQHINDNNEFELIRSTRHFGGLVFFLVWHKDVDNLLLDIIATLHIDEADTLLQLYEIIHNVKFNRDGGELSMLEEYIAKYATKRGELELALQAYKDVAKRNRELEEGIKSAHGVS